MMLREESIIESGGDEAYCSVVVEHSALVAAVAFRFRFDSGMGDIEFTCLIFRGCLIIIVNDRVVYFMIKVLFMRRELCGHNDRQINAH